MRKIKHSEIATVRLDLYVAQGGRCALCQGQFTGSDYAVLDHDHGTGAIRAALHRSCNALLGKVENNAARYGVRQLSAFGQGLGPYLQAHTTNRTGLIHPLHKTEDEKRLARNKAARKRRAVKGAT